MAIERIGGETVVLYSELRERLETFETMRSISTLPGKFITKKIKGNIYHYFQATLSSGRSQIYIGRDNKEIRQLVADKKAGDKDVLADEKLIQRLAAQIIVGGVIPVPPDIARIINRLANSGVFLVNGVLVGSIAFQVIGTHLGMHLDKAYRTTQDVDLASKTGVSLAIPFIQADVPAAIDSLKMGFFPVPRLSHKEPSTSYAIRGKTLRIDLLTPSKTHKTKPVFIRRLNAAAQPLPFLDYLIEGPIQAAMISGTPCLVKVPQPARFALHKLIVSQKRDITAIDKKYKDLAQASVLLDIVKEVQPGDIDPAIKAIEERGPSWIKKLKAGCKAANINL